MATKPIGINFSNCVIDVVNDKIIEYPPKKKKDGEIKVYGLTKTLQSLEGIEGLSFSIVGKDEVAPDLLEY